MAHNKSRLREAVDHPPHYMAGGIETWDYIKAKLTIDELRGYLKGNILKYLSRARFKHDDDGKVDSLKAKWYMDRLAETYE
jgi:hypothetical protein